MENYVLLSLFLAALYAGCGVLNIWLKDGDFVRRWKFLAICSGIVFLSWLGLNYWMTPVIGLDRSQLYWEMFVTLVLGALLFGYDSEGRFEGKRCSFIPAGSVWLLIVVSSIIGGQMVRSKAYRDMLDMTTEVDSVFEKNIRPTSLEKMRTVNQEVALCQVEQTMGEIPSLGSWCEIGEMSLQRISGNFTVTDGTGKEIRLGFEQDFIWAAPLEYRGFWKWSKFKNQGTPGYVLVSATDPSKFYLVTAVNGKPLSLKYLRSAFFGYNLERAVRKAGYTGFRLEDNGIQIDEQGQPFNVFAKQEKAFFWGAEKVVGCITVDMQSGEIKEYGLDEIPAFIDIVQPEGLVYDYISWAGDLVKGYFNWSQEGKFKPTPGLQVVYGDSNCSYYTGIQSVGADHSTSGFILTDVQRGQAIRYNISGTTEDAAQSAINSNEWVAKFKGAYYADDAVFYNVNGLPTYFAPILMNSDGRVMVKGYGFCYVKNREVTGVGSTKEEALSAYLRAYYLMNNRKGISEGNVDDTTEELEILKIRQEGSCYYFKFKGYEDKDFYAFSELLPQVRWLEAEEKPVVKVTFKKSDDRNIPIIGLE